MWCRCCLIRVGNKPAGESERVQQVNKQPLLVTILFTIKSQAAVIDAVSGLSCCNYSNPMTPELGEIKPK